MEHHQVTQRVQCPGMAEQRGCFALSLCFAGWWPLQKESLPSLGDKWQRGAWGGQEGAPGLWNCSGPSGHTEAAGSQAGNVTVGDTVTAEEPQAWKEGWKTHHRGVLLIPGRSALLT